MPPNDDGQLLPLGSQLPSAEPPDASPLSVTADELDELRERGKRQLERLVIKLTELDELLGTTDKAVVDGEPA